MKTNAVDPIDPIDPTDDFTPIAQVLVYKSRVLTGLERLGLTPESIAAIIPLFDAGPVDPAHTRTHRVTAAVHLNVQDFTVARECEVTL